MRPDRRTAYLIAEAIGALGSEGGRRTVQPVVVRQLTSAHSRIVSMNSGFGRRRAVSYRPHKASPIVRFSIVKGQLPVW